MRPLRDFYPKIQPYITGCPEPTLDSALVDAAIAFCQDSQVIHQHTPLFTTEVNRSAYELESPTDQRVSTVRKVWIDGHKISPVPTDQVAPSSESRGRPTHYWGQRGETGFELVLYPTPDDSYTVVADVAFCPTRRATQLDDDLLELWSDAIRSGTLARLWSIPGQSFSDMASASMAAVSFSRQSAEAKRRGDNTRVAASHTVRPRPFV